MKTQYLIEEVTIYLFKMKQSRGIFLSDCSFQNLRQEQKTSLKKEATKLVHQAQFELREKGRRNNSKAVWTVIRRG